MANEDPSQSEDFTKYFDELAPKIEENIRMWLANQAPPLHDSAEKNREKIQEVLQLPKGLMKARLHEAFENTSMQENIYDVINFSTSVTNACWFIIDYFSKPTVPLGRDMMQNMYLFFYTLVPFMQKCHEELKNITAKDASE